jgi:GntR family transcriptional regulator
MHSVMSPRRGAATVLPPGDLDRGSPVPLYRQLADLLREAIAAKVYPPGAQLPPEPALMQHFGVTRPVVRSAFHELRSQGLAVSARGRGTFVREPSERRVRIGGPARSSERFRGTTATFAEIERAGRTPGVRYLAVDRTEASDDIATRLGVPVGTPVARRQRILLIEETPLQIATSYVPWEIAEGTPIAGGDCEPGGSYPHLEAAGHRIASLEEEISARMPTPEERRLLGLPPGTPVIRLVRRALAAGGRVLEVADTVNAADRYILRYPYPYRPEG